jgi:gamma-glutamyltranspeptidase
MTASLKAPGICVSVVCLVFASNAIAQVDDTSGANTMRPVIRGRKAAVSSMKAEATEAARRILEAGGNAFDAAVGGQAALAVTDFPHNGVGSDAVALVYFAREKKVFSVNAEPRAPKLATIEWYEKNNGGKIPSSDGLLSGGLPGVVDAWYVMLDRWGTMSFEQVLQPAIELAENGFPLSEGRAGTIASSKKILKYPSTVKIYLPNGQSPRAGEIFKNPDLARTLKKLVEAEKAGHGKGRHEALKAARDRFYKGDIAREMAAFSEANGGLFRYEDFAEYTAKVETPVSIDYHGYRVYKNPSASQGPTELIALNLLEGYDLKGLGHNSADFIHTNVEALKLAMADREKFLGDMDFIKIPYDGLLSKDYARERRKLIDPAKASLELRPGSPEKFTSDASPLDRPVHTVLVGEADHEGDTSYIAVVDKPLSHPVDSVRHLFRLAGVWFRSFSFARHNFLGWRVPFWGCGIALNSPDSHRFSAARRGQSGEADLEIFGISCADYRRDLGVSGHDRHFRSRLLRHLLDRSNSLSLFLLDRLFLLGVAIWLVGPNSRRGIAFRGCVGVPYSRASNGMENRLSHCDRSDRRVVGGIACHRARCAGFPWDWVSECLLFQIR